MRYIVRQGVVSAKQCEDFDERILKYILNRVDVQGDKETLRKQGVCLDRLYLKVKQGGVGIESAAFIRDEVIAAGMLHIDRVKENK
eukprot:GABW01004335.1.p1 GENE.GABW01004335.1~~GABW01004335.1.p1  ORF type:complete len:86 (+),score=6.80 GABW01004335.1:92-349(+)